MSLAVLDVEELMDRVQDDKELLLELLDIFSGDYEVKRKLLGTAVETNDADEIRSIAHSLKGASGNISAKALRESFIKLEDMSVINDLTTAGEVLVEMDKQYVALSARMSEVKTELSE